MTPTLLSTKLHLPAPAPKRVLRPHLIQRLAKQVAELSGYSAVVVGRAVRMGSWLPEAVDFLARHQASLARMPVAYFTLHILNTGADEVSQKARQAYLDKARSLVKPVTEAYFAGKMDLNQLSFIKKLMAKALKEGNSDQRDWAAILAWGQAFFA